MGNGLLSKIPKLMNTCIVLNFKLLWPYEDLSRETMFMDMNSDNMWQLHGLGYSSSRGILEIEFLLWCRK